jgi:hypothetical protein
MVSVGLCKTIDYENEDFHVVVTGNGNVPKYTYYLNSDADNKYGVQFDSLYECQGSDTSDKCKGKKGNVALASLTWVWSDLVKENNDTVSPCVDTSILQLGCLLL